MPFGQVVIGPPGSGKSTYCNGMAQFLQGLGRKVCVVNLDPANDNVPYEASIDISELVSLDTVMEELGLGPNGGLIYAMEYLEKNSEWLESRLAEYKNHYVVVDTPGQVELFCHHDSLRNILHGFEKRWNYRLTCVHLVDSHYCSDLSKFISVLMLSLSSMVQLELPHLNVLSKIDLINQYGKLAFPLSFFTEVNDTSMMLPHLDADPFLERYAALNAAICELVEDYSLVSYKTLNINDKSSVYQLLKSIDKANGFVATSGNQSVDMNDPRLWSTAGEDQFENDDLVSTQAEMVETVGATGADDDEWLGSSTGNKREAGTEAGTDTREQLDAALDALGEGL